jgi:AcrR family transcriptional regulator
LNSIVSLQSPGLREKKKEQTREQLVIAALRLFTERGYEETSVDDIVDIVNVSKRTFFRYFQSKDDVLVAWVDNFVDKVCVVLESRPRDEKPMLALERAFVIAVELYESQRSLTISLERIIALTPAILGQKLVKLARCAEIIGKVLAKRMQVNARRDFAPAILARCAIGILEAAVDRWRAQGNKGSLSGILEECFHRVEIKVW